MTKKLLTLTKITLLIFSISFLLGSCTKEYYTNDVYIDNPTQWDVFTLNIKQNDWKLSNNGEYFYCTQSVPELDKERAINGALLISRDFGNNIFKPLEYTEFKFQTYDDSTGYYYTETVSFDYSPEIIIFYVKTSDLNDDIASSYKPESMDFKVTIIY